MRKPIDREKHSEYVQTTFTPTQRQKIEKAAKDDGRTVSAWLRQAALAALPRG